MHYNHCASWDSPSNSIQKIAQFPLQYKNLKPISFLNTPIKIPNIQKKAQAGVPLRNAGIELEEMASLHARMAAAVMSCLLHTTYHLVHKNKKTNDHENLFAGPH